MPPLSQGTVDEITKRNAEAWQQFRASDRAKNAPATRATQPRQKQTPQTDDVPTDSPFRDFMATIRGFFQSFDFTKIWHVLKKAMLDLKEANGPMEMVCILFEAVMAVFG